MTVEIPVPLARPGAGASSSFSVPGFVQWCSGVPEQLYLLLSEREKWVIARWEEVVNYQLLSQRTNK